MYSHIRQRHQHSTTQLRQHSMIAYLAGRSGRHIPWSHRRVNIALVTSWLGPRVNAGVSTPRVATFWQPPMATASALRMLIFLTNRFCRHLWTDLCETLTYDAYRWTTKHSKRFFGYWFPQKFGGPKTTYFSSYLRQGTGYRHDSEGSIHRLKSS